jgi:glycyl-tRNA synthetase beta subunit
MTEFIFEILTQEIPGRMQEKAKSDFAVSISKRTT